MNLIRCAPTVVTKELQNFKCYLSQPTTNLCLNDSKTLYVCCSTSFLCYKKQTSHGLQVLEYPEGLTCLNIVIKVQSSSDYWGSYMCVCDCQYYDTWERAIRDESQT